MFDTNSFADRIFSLKKGDAAAFEALAMEAFRYQSAENDVYGRFIKALGVDAASVDSIHKIPFLPISLFKSMKVVTGGFIPQEVFTSSGTTGMAQSRHYVKSLELYRRSFFTSWELHYGPVEDYAVLALLPSYLEREGSSLIVMADGFIKRSRHPESGFFLYQHEELRDRLEKLSSSGVKILLLGVSFAFLDFVEKYSVKLPETAVVMETGGMKGRRKEMVREELHAILKEGFGVRSIHSEYGMTELLSQAYSKGAGLYTTPPWMRIRIRDAHDPLSPLAGTGHRGGIDVTDLANIDSCCFISTEDLGINHEDGTFEVLGRFTGSDIRGCNLMVAE